MYPGLIVEIGVATILITATVIAYKYFMLPFKREKTYEDLETHYLDQWTEKKIPSIWQKIQFDRQRAESKSFEKSFRKILERKLMEDFEEQLKNKGKKTKE